MENVDHLVIGGGVMGSAAAWQLARRGRSVVLLERFHPGHAQGASHGASRIYRQTYDRAEYLDLTVEALGLWRELEDATGAQLLTLTGGVSHGELAPSVLAAFRARGIPHEVLSPAEAGERWTGLRFEGSVLHETHTAGRLHADRSVAALQSAAAALGADVRHGVRVLDLVGRTERRPRRDLGRSGPGPSRRPRRRRLDEHAARAARSARRDAGAARPLRPRVPRRVAVVHAPAARSAPVPERDVRAADPRRGRQGRVPRGRPRDRPRPPLVRARTRAARAAAAVRRAVDAGRRPVATRTRSRARTRPPPTATSSSTATARWWSPPGSPATASSSAPRSAACWPTLPTSPSTTPSGPPIPPSTCPVSSPRSPDDPRVPLSVLDLAPVWEGGTGAEALRAALDRARLVESLGYRRIWFAEHHLAPGVASAAPGVLAALAAGVTSTLRVGSAAVLLGSTSPVVAAEQFGTIAAAHPGRVDLGLGRASLPAAAGQGRRAAAVPDRAPGASAGPRRRRPAGAGEPAVQLPRPRPARAVRRAAALPERGAHAGHVHRRAAHGPRPAGGHGPVRRRPRRA